MRKLLLILLCLPIIGFGQNVNIPDGNFKAYLVGNTAINTNGDSEIQVSEELKCNICDSIILINPDKQKTGEWILDFRKTRNLVGEWENTRWKYTYGNNPGNFYDINFVPDTLVACVWSETVESTKCCSKWAWDGLSWIKQKSATLKQAKSYIESPKPQR